MSDMHELLSKINTLLMEADIPTKKLLLTQLHNDINKNPVSPPPPSADLVSYCPKYVSKDKDEVLLASLAIDLEMLERKHVHTVTTRPKPTSIWLGSTPYKYTGSSHPTIDMSSTPGIAELMNKLNGDKRFGRLTSCLAVYYPNEEAALSLHSDDESEYLDLRYPMAIMSFGCTRTLEFYPKEDIGNARRKRVKPVKSINMDDGSLTIMFPGCQESLCHRVPRSEEKTGGRWALSFRSVITEEPSPSSPISEAIDTSGDLFDGHSAPSESLKPKKPMTLILGTSITKGLIPNKMTRRNNTCHNISGSGYKLSDLDRELDNFYREDRMQDCRVVKAIISVGTNDIRYCKGVINHLKTPLTNLIEKLRVYYPDIKIFIQSVLPVRIVNEFTVLNVRRYNSMLFNTCRERKCYYVDVFKNFLTAGGHFNEYLFSDGCHLKPGCLGMLARSFIPIINKDIFNPLISFPKLYVS